MTSYLAKPPSYRSPGGRMPGIRQAWILHEGSGPPHDASGLRNDMAVAGSAGSLWGRGLYGPQMSGFSTSNYAWVDQAAGQGYMNVFPMWIAICFTFPSGSTAKGYAFEHDSTAGGSFMGFVTSRTTLDGKIRFTYANPSGTTIDLLGPTVNDGLPHVAVATLESATAIANRLYVDNVLYATNTTDSFNVGCHQTTLGASRSGSSVSNPFPGAVIGVIEGINHLPDIKRLTQDFFWMFREPEEASFPIGLGLVPALAAGGAGIAYRRTRSEWGTKAGRRQMGAA